MKTRRWIATCVVALLGVTAVLAKDIRVVAVSYTHLLPPMSEGKYFRQQTLRSHPLSVAHGNVGRTSYLRLRQPQSLRPRAVSYTHRPREWIRNPLYAQAGKLPPLEEVTHIQPPVVASTALPQVISQ